MAKKRFNDKKEETEYHKYLKDMVKENPTLKLENYISLLPKNLNSISNGTLCKDFKKANIVYKKELVTILSPDNKTQREEEKWIYKEIVPDVLDGYPVEFNNYMTGTVDTLKNISCLRIPVNWGSEELVCKKIIKTFKSGGIICIPAFGSVCILSDNGRESKLDDIKKILNDIYEH